MVRLFRNWLTAIAVSLGLTLSGGSVLATTIDALVISEVFYDRSGSDNGFEWIEIFNGSPLGVDLAAFSLGYGGENYTSTMVSLGGIIGAGEYVVVGGPRSDASNASPNYHLAIDFSPDLQNAGYVADGIALFDGQPSQNGVDSVPIDAVIYGGANINQFINADGQVLPPMVGDAPSGSSIERNSSKDWSIARHPNPGVGILVPTRLSLPGTLILFTLGLCFLPWHVPNKETTPTVS